MQTGRGRVRLGGGVEGVSRRETEKQRDLPHFRSEPKVTMPNDVAALICWRLAVERVFNQSV